MAQAAPCVDYCGTFTSVIMPAELWNPDNAVDCHIGHIPDTIHQRTGFKVELEQYVMENSLMY